MPWSDHSRVLEASSKIVLVVLGIVSVVVIVSVVNNSTSIGPCFAARPHLPHPSEGFQGFPFGVKRWHKTEGLEAILQSASATSAISLMPSPCHRKRWTWGRQIPRNGQSGTRNFRNAGAVNAADQVQVPAGLLGDFGSGCSMVLRV